MPYHITETAQAAQNLLLLRMTNALVSDDWLCHFLNKAMSIGIDVNQLVIPNKNGDKKSLLFYIIEKGFMEKFGACFVMQNNSI